MSPGALWYIIHSYVEKFLFAASYEAKYTINNRWLVQFTFSHDTEADKKRKLKLKISNASLTDTKSASFWTLKHMLKTSCVRKYSAHRAKLTAGYYYYYYGYPVRSYRAMLR